MRARTVATGALALLASVVVAAGCGSDPASSKRDDDRSAADRGAQPTTTDEVDPSAQPPIVVDSPAMFQSVYQRFDLAGTAVTNEGALRWQILDGSGRPLASGSMTASCGAPCRGEYSTAVDVRKVKPGSWELHVFEPPTADDDPARGNDTIVPITITTGPIDPDAPAPDATPPGGVPTSPAG